MRAIIAQPKNEQKSRRKIFRLSSRAAIRNRNRENGETAL